MFKFDYKVSIRSIYCKYCRPVNAKEIALIVLPLKYVSPESLSNATELTFPAPRHETHETL